MADNRSVRPLGLIRKLGIVVDRHHFEISAVVFALDAPRVYPILLDRPWLLLSLRLDKPKHRVALWNTSPKGGTMRDV